VLGESAGGHLAAFVGMTGKSDAFDEGDYTGTSSAVQAACCLYPPIDLKLMAEQIIERDRAENTVAQGQAYISPEAIMLGNDPLISPELVKKANPLTYLDNSAPPFAIFHGTKDRTVPIAQGEMLHDALVKNGTPVTMYRLKGATHASIEFFQPELKALVLGFFDSVLK
jgi:acetyl esterase/lipase